MSVKTASVNIFIYAIKANNGFISIPLVNMQKNNNYLIVDKNLRPLQ